MPNYNELILGRVVGPAGANGKNGRDGQDGQDGKSPYQVAVEGGWSGTEADFNAALANVGDIGPVLDAINGEVI
jgi:hypothetical protein